MSEQGGRKENEFVELFAARYDGKIKLDPGEVADGKFVGKNQIYSMMKTLAFTPWFLDEWTFLKAKDFSKF
jgi:isopentenyldiphosphate isomerase